MSYYRNYKHHRAGGEVLGALFFFLLLVCTRIGRIIIGIFIGILFLVFLSLICVAIEGIIKGFLKVNSKKK